MGHRKHPKKSQQAPQEGHFAVPDRYPKTEEQQPTNHNGPESYCKFNPPVDRRIWKMTVFEWAMASLTFLALCVGGLTGLFIFNQVQVTRADQRPWMKGSRNGSFQIDASNANVSLRFTNIGKTPARNFKVVCFFKKVSNYSSPNLDTWRSPPGEPSTISEIGTVFPNDFIDVIDNRMVSKSQTEVVSAPFSAADLEELQKGNAYVVAYGEVRYSDVFGIQHWTKFCDWTDLVPGGTYTAAMCSRYNDTDDNK
jgi:hypothetical protein